MFKGNDLGQTDIEIVIEPIKRHRRSEILASHTVGLGTVER